MRGPAALLYPYRQKPMKPLPSPLRAIAFHLATLVLSPLLQAGLTPGSKNIGAVWFIGDSITQSNADGDGNGSPRKSLYDLLMANGYNFTYTGHWTANIDGLPDTGATPDTNLYQYHSGISGSVIGSDYSGRTGMTAGTPGFWTSGRLAVVKPDVILIMLGTNDVDVPIDLPNAPGRLTTLLNTIYAQPGVRNPSVFVASIPPNRTTIPDDPTNTAAFNAAVPGVVTAQQALGREVRFVDNFTPLNNAYATNMMGDNLHPNATGNNTMAQQWFNAISSVVTMVPAGSSITMSGAPASLDTNNTPAAGYATAATYSGDILATDLINAGQATLLSAGWDKTPNFQIGSVNDGLGHPADSAAGTYLPATYGSGNKLPFTYTATLNTTVNPLGYNITTIRTFAGWNQNGSSLANQKYELQVHTVGSASFTSLGIFQYSPFTNGSTREAAATKMTLTDHSGLIATRVDAVRFVVLAHGFNSSDSGTGGLDESVYQEFDVIGSAVPTGFEAWAAASGVPADPANDDDHDGIPALMEYALGLDPTAPSVLPALEAAGANYRITWPKGYLAGIDSRLSYTVQVSADLINWQPAASGDVSQTTSRITYTLPVVPDCLFTRLAVSRSSP